MESKFNFTLRDLIYIITLILGVAGTYYTLKAKVDNLEEQIKGHNLQLIEYKIDKIESTVDKIYEKLQ